MADKADFSSDNNSNLLQFKKKKRGRPKNTPSPQDGTNPSDEQIKPSEIEKPSPAQVQAHLVRLLEGKGEDLRFLAEPLKSLPDFPQKIMVFRNRREDTPVLAEIKDNTAYFTTLENVAADLSNHCGEMGGIHSVYNITLPQAETVVRWFSFKSKSSFNPLPPTWGFKSYPGICFNRLNYDPIPVHDILDLEKYAPTFAEMLSRTSNEDALCALLGSLFFDEASRKQAGWMFGASGGGKSQLQAILTALLGSAVAYFNNHDFDDSFWTAELLDKRAAYIEECDVNFLRTNIFKALTGVRNLRIRRMYTQGFTGSINTILFASSNHRPLIPNDNAIKNRVIPFEVEVLAKERKLPELEVHRRLISEAPYIAGYCMGRFQDLCPNYGEITFDTKKYLLPHVDEFESNLLDKLEAGFRVVEGESITTMEFTRRCRDVGIHTEDERNKFLEFISSRFSFVRHGRPRLPDGSQPRSILGLIRSDSPS